MICILSPGDGQSSSPRWQVRNHSAEGKLLAQGQADGEALGVSVLILGSPGPGWRLPRDSYPPGGRKEKPSPFSLLGSSRPSQVSLGPSCPLARARQHRGSPPLWWRRSPCGPCTRGPGLGHLALGPDQGWQGWLSRRPGWPPPALCLPFELLL